MYTDSLFGPYTSFVLKEKYSIFSGGKRYELATSFTNIKGKKKKKKKKMCRKRKLKRQRKTNRYRDIMGRIKNTKKQKKEGEKKESNVKYDKNKTEI